MNFLVNYCYWTTGLFLPGANGFAAFAATLYLLVQFRHGLQLSDSLFKKGRLARFTLLLEKKIFLYALIHLYFLFWSRG